MNVLEEKPKKLYKGTEKIIGFFPINENTIHLLRLFYSNNGIITVCGHRVSSSWYYYIPNQILKLVAGYIRPKHTSLTLFINLFQECRLHPSDSMKQAQLGWITFFILHINPLEGTYNDAKIFQMTQIKLLYYVEFF